MAQYITTSEELTSIANAIRTKTGGSSPLTYPAGFVSAIDAIPTGGGGTPVVKAIFIDYDGTVIAEKTKDEVSAMTSDADLPSNPSHTGLVAQGWNWTVAQLKAQFTSMPDQDIIVGQHYATSSGATEIDIELLDERLSPVLSIAVQGTVTVDWGDGTAPDTVAGNSMYSLLSPTHTYANSGSYTISILESSNTQYTFYCESTKPLLRKNNSTITNEHKVYTGSVKRVRIGAGLSLTQLYSFYYCCSLETITVPKDAIGIAMGSNFCYCFLLKSITIPYGTTNIGGNAFYNCYSLVYASVPCSVTSIGTSAFSLCHALKMITLPSALTSLGGYAFQNCELLEYAIIPSGVTTISDSTFIYCVSLKSISLHSAITTIGNSAFSYCVSLLSVVIPNSVTAMGYAVFKNCYSLESVTLSNRITKIAYQSFYYCYSLKSITIPDTVTSIGYGAFQYCYTIPSIIIPNGVTSIGYSAFSGCKSLKSITLPSSLESIDYSAFNSCYSLKSITIPNKITTILKNTFDSCNTLEYITIQGNVTNIAESTFANCCNLKSITLPNTLTSIGDMTFQNCYVLGTVTVPNSVANIGKQAFQNCTGVKEYHFLSEQVPTAGTTMFTNIPSDCVIYVPYSSDHSILNAYQTATNWSTYASKMQEEPT